MQKKVVVFLLLLASCLALLITACAGIESGRKIIPTKLVITDNFLLPFKAEKCLMDAQSNTYYILEQDRPKIYFYRNKQQVNAIGGFGNEKINFQKLSDIAIDPDGNLLTLDSFAKLIRKFSYDGKWIADINVTGFTQPTRFCSTYEGDLIIYDNATKEIKRISGFDNREMFSFGRFQVDSVFNISSSRDYVAVISGDRSKTVLFSGIGLFLNDFPAQIVLDQYQNQYFFQDGAVRVVNSDAVLPFGWVNSEVRLYATGQVIILVRNNNILALKPTFIEN